MGKCLFCEPKKGSLPFFTLHRLLCLQMSRPLRPSSCALSTRWEKILLQSTKRISDGHFTGLINFALNSVTLIFFFNTLNMILCCFLDCIFITNFQRFDYVPYVFFLCFFGGGLMSFLDLQVYSFYQIWKFSSHYFLKNIFYDYLSPVHYIYLRLLDIIPHWLMYFVCHFG